MPPPMMFIAVITRGPGWSPSLVPSSLMTLTSRYLSCWMVLGFNMVPGFRRWAVDRLDSSDDEDDKGDQL